jgi:hypothetical protein
MSSANIPTFINLQHHNSSETSESPSSVKTVTSEDEALCELLKLDGFTLDGSWSDETDKIDGTLQTPEHDYIPYGSIEGENVQSSYIRQHIPPRDCQRPNTNHTPLLLETSPNLLSEAQCSYIIYNLGYRTSNDGGKTYGPTYVKSARPERNDNNPISEFSIDLRTPNPHKVCVFQSELVLTWIERALQKAGLETILRSWLQQTFYSSQFNHDNKIYRLHPRLRMLQYDANDNDIFPPHYDATTTWRDPISGNIWESQLTVLLYLTSSSSTTTAKCSNPSTLKYNNTLYGGGGATRFQSILDPTRHYWDYYPQRGTILMFTHELYHSSQPLTHGTKLVLRTDILFPPLLIPTIPNFENPLSPSQIRNQEDENDSSSVTTISLELPSATTLQQALDAFQETIMHNTTTNLFYQSMNWKESLGLDSDEPISHLMSLGSRTFQDILQDVGWDETSSQQFWSYCTDHYHP